MVYLRSSVLYFFAWQLICSTFSFASPYTVKKQAELIVKNNCKKLLNDQVAAPILYTAADLVMLVKTIDIETEKGSSYSMKGKPQCIMKGDTTEKVIVIRNLGKTKCGSSNVEKDSVYLFFLFKTNDSKVYDALNEGAKMVNSPVVWTSVFTMFCGIKKITKCSGDCPQGCSYSPPPDGACIPTDHSVTDAFNLLYPKGFPTTTPPPPSTTTTTTTTNKPTATTTTVKTVTYASDEKKTPKVEKVKKGDGTTGQAGLSANLLLTFSAIVFFLVFRQ